MESQGRGYPSWDTTGRRATIFPQREGCRAPGPSVLLTQQGETDVVGYRPPLARKRGVCDFRVRWPKLVPRDQEVQKEGLPITGQGSSEKTVQGTSSCSSGINVSLKKEDSVHSDLKDSVSFPELCESLYMTILHNYLKPDWMTPWEKRVRDKTMMVLNQLEREMEALKVRQAVLLQDTRKLQEEKESEEVQNKPLIDYLKNRNRRSQDKHEALWKDYIQQFREIHRRRCNLLSTFASSTTDLQEQLVQGREIDADLKKQLQVLKPIAQVRESQDREREALELEEARIEAAMNFIDSDEHFQFLRDRVALEKQVEELNLLQSGEDITRELKKKARALKAMAKKAHEEFCQSVSVENKQLRTQFRELDRECCKLEARRQKLEKGKQRWKEQQWYLEALTRGRQRLQQQECRTPKQHTAPHPTQGQLLGARPRANPK